MKKTVILVLCCFLMVLTMVGCNNADTGQSNENEGQVNTGDADDDVVEPSAQATDLTFWTYVDLHKGFMEDAVERWNEKNPEEQINLNCESYPLDDMHSKLLITLQSGQGAPDLVDVNVARFSSFMKGDDVGFISLNDIIDPNKSSFLEPVLDIYKHDGTYYGIEYHVGAPVMYYNTEILGQAGVKVEDIKTWDDFHAAGKKVVEATGIPMITYEVADSWGYYVMIGQQQSDYFDTSGNCIINNETNVNTLQFMLDMINDGSAIATPGGGYHTEEYYGFMENGGAASMIEPLWYMGRFTDFMPGLKGKIQIANLPSWDDNSVAPVFGGTSTCITTQCESQELAKRFLYEAKISEEGAVQIWNVLGFDPLRWDVWETDAMKASNTFTDYFGSGIFDIVIQMKDKFHTSNITAEQFPLANQLIAGDVMFKVLGEKSMTPQEGLDQAAQEIQEAE